MLAVCNYIISASRTANIFAVFSCTKCFRECMCKYFFHPGSQHYSQKGHSADSAPLRYSDLVSQTHLIRSTKDREFAP